MSIIYGGLWLYSNYVINTGKEHDFISAFPVSVSDFSLKFYACHIYISMWYGNFIFCWMKNNQLLFMYFLLYRTVKLLLSLIRLRHQCNSLLSNFVLLNQGLYPGYLIFFVQSALMIAGSRGIDLTTLTDLYLYQCFISSNTLLFPEQSFTGGNKQCLRNWLLLSRQWDFSTSCTRFWFWTIPVLVSWLVLPSFLHTYTYSQI